MRFSTVEVERAYSDYLDSLDDWPPPADERAGERATPLALMTDFDAGLAPGDGARPN